MRPRQRPSFPATVFFLPCFLLPFIDFFANFYQALFQQEKQITGFLPVQEDDCAAGKTRRFLTRREGLCLASGNP